MIGGSWLLAALLSFGQSGPPLVVGAVDVAGAHRYTQADIMRISGLQVGQAVTVSDLNAAAQRMAETGLFKKLNYRYATAAGKTTVTFEIEESEWTMPVVFDNFVWWTDEAIVAALRETVPSFDGKAPVTEGFTDFLSRELKKLLESRQIPGSVTFVPQGTLNTGIDAFAFKVGDPAPKLCTLTFPGASAISDADLRARVGLTADSDYSKSYVASVARGTLTNMYRQRGHWRAVLEPPKATFEKGSACSGALVTVRVNEGPAYAWDHAEWTGNGALPAADLDQQMSFKNGEVASITKLEDGLTRVEKAYGTRGYITASTSYEPRLTESPSRVVFQIRVNEGPQFRFGTLSFAGLDPKGIEILTKQWRLKAGDIFDASYPGKFLFDEIRPRLPQTVKPPTAKWDVDEKNRLVNVTYVFGAS